MLRRALPDIAIRLVLAVAATDWPVGGTCWVDHPLVAAVVGGAALLVLAGTGFDAYVAHRKRQDRADRKRRRVDAALKAQSW